MVAPHTGSVDRNNKETVTKGVMILSLPTRGAWIEISMSLRLAGAGHVAPHTGSVDRNLR